MKTCPIDEENKRIWKEVYEIIEDGCIKLTAIKGFDPSKCPQKEECKKVNEQLLKTRQSSKQTAVKYEEIEQKINKLLRKSR